MELEPRSDEQNGVRLSLSCTTQENKVIWEATRDALRRSAIGDGGMSPESCDALMRYYSTNNTRQPYLQELKVEEAQALADCVADAHTDHEEDPVGLPHKIVGKFTVELAVVRLGEQIAEYSTVLPEFDFSDASPRDFE